MCLRVRHAPCAADPERPPLQSAASAPAEHGADEQHAADQVHRTQSEPAGGAKQRKAQKDTLTPEQRATLRHVQVRTVADAAAVSTASARHISMAA
jgi:hypothetical protein